MGGLTGGAGSQLSSAISGTGIFGGGTDLARQYGSGSSGASSALALAAFA